MMRVKISFIDSAHSLFVLLFVLARLIDPILITYNDHKLLPLG